MLRVTRYSEPLSTICGSTLLTEARESVYAKTALAQGLPLCTRLIRLEIDSVTAMAVSDSGNARCVEARVALGSTKTPGPAQIRRFIRDRSGCPMLW